MMLMKMQKIMKKIINIRKKVVTIEDQNKTLEYQETTKLDIENIASTTKKIFISIYKVIYDD